MAMKALRSAISRPTNTRTHINTNVPLPFRALRRDELLGKLHHRVSASVFRSVILCACGGAFSNENESDTRKIAWGGGLTRLSGVRMSREWCLDAEREQAARAELVVVALLVVWACVTVVSSRCWAPKNLL